MTKAELVAAIAKDAGLPKTKAEATLNSFMDNVSKSLKRGKKVTLIGFGTFSVAKRKKRKGRNPKTGQPIVIPAAKVPKFSASKALKDGIKK